MDIALQNGQRRGQNAVEGAADVFVDFRFFEEMRAVAEPPIIARRRKFTGRMSTPNTEKRGSGLEVSSVSRIT